MHFRPFKSFIAASLASTLLVTLAPDAGAAGAKDKDAMKLHDKAMNDDYLATEFAKAEKKLKEALALCGASNCSNEVLGKLHVSLGTVYGVGLSKLDQAKDSFVAALKADSKAALDSSLTTPELTKAFEEAKKSVGGGKADGDKPKKPKETNATASGHTPPAESMVNTPLPIYFEPPEDQGVSKVSLRYKPFGAQKYKSIEMKKMGKGFGVEIACDDVTTTGDMKYYFVLTDENGDAAGTTGSQNEPYKVPLKNEIEGDAPRLPGKKPPDACRDKTCPPGLPGCTPGDGGGPKGGGKWGDACDEARPCGENLHCGTTNTCEEGAGPGGGGGGGKGGWQGKPNMVGLSASLDALIITGAEDVCSGNASYVCYLQDSAGNSTSKQFYGKPLKVGNTNGIQGGFGVPGAHFNLQYDRQILKTLGLVLGARFGIVAGGSPSPENDPPKGGNPKIGKATPFPPIHIEGRASWFFGGAMFEAKKFHPYVFLSGGFAQVNASVPVSVCDELADPTFDQAAKGCFKDSTGVRKGQARNVDAYQITGLNFIGIGGGSTYAITQNFGVMAELKIMFMLTTFGVVFNPTIGPVVGF